MSAMLILMISLTGSAGPYRIEAQVLPGGAQAADGGTYSLSATLGDSSTAAPASGGPYRLQGGALAAASQLPEEGLAVFGNGFES